MSSLESSKTLRQDTSSLPRALNPAIPSSPEKGRFPNADLQTPTSQLRMRGWANPCTDLRYWMSVVSLGRLALEDRAEELEC
ncbi:uncharacterized protein MYCGRDRAFT_106491, partial [Zymoseptoria tritici IPO323]